MRIKSNYTMSETILKLFVEKCGVNFIIKLREK
jgi:hypothetical protein